MIETQPLEIDDFSGGITDYFIDGDPSQAEKMDNLWISPDKDLQTRWGSILYTEEQIPLGQFRIHALSILEDEVLAFAGRRLYKEDGTSWLELEGPPSDGLFPSGDANIITSRAEWRGHIFVASNNYQSVQKIFKDNADDFQVRNAGLPDVPSGTSVANPSGAGSTYLYAFNLSYTYKVGQVTFLDRGPVYFYPTLVTGGTITSGNGAVITLPITIAVPENWDTANIKIEIARTVNGGSEYFYVTSQPLGTASYTDETEDASLLTGEALYTSGGVFSNDTPPKCKFVHVVNDIGYYANMLNEEGDIDEYLVRQSIPGDVDSVPASFFEKTEQKIRGLSSIFDRPLVFTERYIYRIENATDATGIGDMSLRRIDDRAGCAGQNSIVQTHKGLFWAGEEGFYWTDGFEVKKISDNLNKTFESLTLNETRKARIYGTFNAATERVHWAVCRDDGANEPDILFTLDLKFPLRPQSTFTTSSGGVYFRPTSVLAKRNSLLRGDTRGFVLEHNDSYFTDPKIDTTTSPANWNVLTIIHTYKSCFVDFGSKFLRKWVPRILVSAGNTTNLTLAIFSSNDNNRITGQLRNIEYVGNITWGDALPIWGDPDARWNIQGLVEEWRRFPARGLRCQYKQVEFTNGLREILGSDLLGQVTVNSGSKTATLGGSFVWIEDAVDYFLSFGNDGYQEQFLVTIRTNTTLTFQDTNGKSPSGQQDFKLTGKPKGEVLALTGYVIHWAYISKSHTPFSSGS